MGLTHHGILFIFVGVRVPRSCGGRVEIKQGRVSLFFMTTAQKQEEQQNIASLTKTEVGALKMLRPGDLVEGVILEKGSRMVTVDLGPHGTGVVYRGEIQNARDIIRGLAAGDPINGKVIDPDNEEGYIELSLSQADKQKSWEAVQDLKDQEEIIVIKAMSANKGGLVADLQGLSAFLPVSQIVGGFEGKDEINNKDEIVQILEGLVGKEIEVRIIDVNPRTNKLIVSEKAAKEESMRELVKNYAVGQEVEGVVSGIADFGVFVKFTDNPSVEGLIHISELGYKIIENPKELVRIDDVVKAKIVDIKDGKISLSLKALKADPWARAGERFREGQETRGKVHSFHPFGAIIDVDDDLQGQVHVASFGSVEEMKKKLVQGETYAFSVESMNAEERKMLLKMKE